MAIVLFLLAILFSTLVSFVVGLVEALIFRYFLQFTGLPYDPTYWQAFFFCFIFNILVSWSNAGSNATKS